MSRARSGPICIWRATRSGSRLCAPRARCSGPDGRLVFDVFTPSREDVEETHGRWIEREPGIDERADWDLAAQTLTLSVRGPGGASTMVLAWLEPERWHSLLAEAGFEVTACYGWFDRRPYAGGEDSVWVAHVRK